MVITNISLMETTYVADGKLKNIRNLSYVSLLTYPRQFPTTFRVMWLTYTFGKQLWTQNPNNQISQLKILPHSIAQLIPPIHDRSSSLIPNTKSSLKAHPIDGIKLINQCKSEEESTNEVFLFQKNQC